MMDVRVLFVSGDERTYSLPDGSKLKNLLDALALEHNTIPEVFTLLDAVNGREIEDTSVALQANDGDDAGGVLTYTVIWRSEVDVVSLSACKALQSKQMSGWARADRVRDCLDVLVGSQEDETRDVKRLLNDLFLWNTETTMERNSPDMTAESWYEWFARAIDLTRDRYHVTRMGDYLTIKSMIAGVIGGVGSVEVLLDRLREEPIGIFSKEFFDTWRHACAYEIKVGTGSVDKKLLIIWDADIFVTKDGSPGSSEDDWMLFDLRRDAWQP